MKIRYFFNLILISVIAMACKVAAMENDSTDNTYRRIQERKIKNLPLKLVLGATNKECGRLAGDEWVFWDTSEHNPEGNPYFKLDFNEEGNLLAVAQKYGPTFDEIILDDSTYKFVQWNVRHLKCFSAMLKDNGKFVFVPSYLQSPSWSGSIPSKKEEIFEEMKRINPLYTPSKSSRMCLPICYILPILDKSVGEENTKEVCRQFEVECLASHIVSFIKDLSFKKVTVTTNAPFPILSNFRKPEDLCNVVITSEEPFVRFNN
jgi:hypothetical protein